MLDHQLQAKFIEALLAVPATGTPNGRDALLMGLPLNVVAGLNRSGNRYVDLVNLVSQLDGLGRLTERGAWPLVVVAGNAMWMVEGMKVAERLREVVGELEGLYGVGKKQAVQAKTVFEQRNQTVGSQINIAGDATGPILSGTFYGSVSLHSDGQADRQQGGTPAIAASTNESPQASSSDLSASNLVDLTKKQELVKYLLAIPAIADRERRMTVLGQLRAEIRTTIQYHAADNTHVFNMVETALQYTGGMQELRDILKFFEKNSIPMQRFEEALTRLLVTG